MEEVKEEKTEEKLIDERKEKLIAFFKNSGLWIIPVLLVAVVLGVYIRSLPMQDHSGAMPSLSKFILSPEAAFGGRPGLWDITTNTWTLGPDLDPFLFLKNAKTMLEQGSLPKIDYMRNVPVGFDNSYWYPFCILSRTLIIFFLIAFKKIGAPCY